MNQNKPALRQPVPRGIARSGPVIFSYGFRPFFFGAGLWAIAAMALWVLELAFGLGIGGSYGGAHWHAHEMLFGYSSAALAGFLLTAVPNWTGRLPVSGTPLIVLFVVWCAGRAALLLPDVPGVPFAIAIDVIFLPLLLAICAREIIAGRKWRDLKILGAIAALALANGCFHLLVATNGDVAMASRLAVSAYVMLISIMGGRVIPSFTRNWLAKRAVSKLPVPYNRFDTLVLLVGLVTLVEWVIWPDTTITMVLATLSAGLHLARLVRWRGWMTGAEKLVLVLHVGYAFVPLGFAAIAAAQLGWIEPIAALHVLTVGAIGLMTLAIMSRATRGHTGLPLAASRLTFASYGALTAAALLRPLASLWPDHGTELLSLTGICWIMAFVLYTIEYAPVLLTKRRDREA